ncbi:MAG: trypsin-like peptidase domain-containing protein [Gammaproteobacteria bacterium]|nr:trypsin-like peptidase domain-containing protein [Gammaproteobacteria bacterium]MCP5444220.1 trypsin-like peptidase domain-containing protein [Chromatiaceae bacterium]
MKRSNWRLFKQLIAVGLMLVCSGVSADLPGVINQVRPSVVAVGTVQPTRSPRSVFLGTGFGVGGGRHVITNMHVIPDKIDFQRKESIAVFSGRGKNAKVHTAELVARDDDHDLALLEIQGQPLTALKIGNSDGVREGEEYAFTGFPIGMVLGLYPVTHRGIISAVTPIVIPSTSADRLSASQIRRMRNPYTVFQLDAIAYPGNSGSPLYDTNTGRVVGVINSVFVKQTKETVLSAPSGISYAIPAQYVTRLLQKAGISK